MKRTRMLAFVLACTCLAAAGCNHEITNSTDSAASAPASVVDSKAPAASETQPAESSQPPRDLTGVDVNAQHIVDMNNQLDAQTLQSLNLNAAYLSKTLHIQLAVLLVSDLENQKPAEYAAQRYATLCGAGTDGILILLNNATGEDVIYTSGVCTRYLPEAEIQNLLVSVSPTLALGDVKTALEAIFTKLETVCPSHVFDAAQKLDAAQVNTLETAADSIAAAHNCKLAVLLQNGATQALADETYASLYGTESGALLLLDPQTGALFAALGGALREQVSGTSLGALLDKTNASMPADPAAAAQRFFEGIGELAGREG